MAENKNIEVDSNDYTTIRDNVITKEGVFMYSGKSLGIDGLDPNKLYPVYRPQEELDKMVKRWTEKGDKPIPVIEGHTVLNKEDITGSVSYDEKPAKGVLFALKSLAGKVAGDITLYSKQLINTIRGGKDELSLGYACDYEPKKGVFKGKIYDYVQKNLYPNHLALVQMGRMGHDVNIALDSNEMRFACDSIELGKEEIPEGKDNMENTQTGDEFIDVAVLKQRYPNDVKWIDENKYQRRDKGEKRVVTPTESSKTNFVTSNNKEQQKDKNMDEDKGKSGGGEQPANDADVDKREAIREIMAIAAKPESEFKGGAEEKERTIAGLAEKIAYNKSSEGTANDGCGGGEGGEGKQAKDADPQPEPKEDDKKKEDEGEGEGKKGFAGDEAEIRKSVLRTIREQENFGKKIFPYCGAFAYDEMDSVEDMAAEACKKLGLKDYGNPMATIEGYLAAAKKSATFAMDSGIQKKMSVEDRVKSMIQ